ncbi:uncharacterized protein [Dysidea avara]
MLQYCNNVQHLSLPSTTLDPEQLRNIIHHMGCLQALEFKVLKVGDGSEIKQLLLNNTGQLRELTIISDTYYYLKPRELFTYWKILKFRPSRLNFIAIVNYNNFERLAFYVSELNTIPTGTTAIFRVYNKSTKVPINFSPTLPHFQLQLEESGQVTIPCVKLSDFGILGLDNDVAVMTDCQYGGKTVYMVKYQIGQSIVSQQNFIHIVRFSGISCATHFDLSYCSSLHSGHLEQLAINCPNLQELNLGYSHCCLQSLQGLRAIATHCHNLQGLNLLGTHVSKVEDHILLWEILSDMKLTHLAVEFCVLRATKKEKLICLYQKCYIRGIQCEYCRYCGIFTDEDTLMLSYFPSLNCCYLQSSGVVTAVPTIVQDVVNNCNELECVRFYLVLSQPLSLVLTHSHTLQQLYINSLKTIVPNDFMASFSAHGGLVHVVMMVGSLTAEGITSLVRSSPKLITLYLHAGSIHHGDVDVDFFSAKLKKMFCKRRLFTAGYYMVNYNVYGDSTDVLWEHGTDLLPLWD